MTIATLIVDVLANTATIQSDVDKINSKLDTVGGAATAVGGYLAKAFTVTAVAAAAKDVLDFASRLTDLSAKTGISVRDLQRLEYAGNLVGVSLEQTTMAVSQMQNRLAGGDTSAVAALSKLHLSLEDLADLNPAQWIEAVATAIAKVPDPAERTHLAMALLGKTGAAMLPLLLTNIKAVGDEAEKFGGIMGDDVVGGADDLGDAISSLATYGRKMISDWLKPALTLMPQMRADWDLFTRAAGEAVKIPPPPLLTAKGAAEIHLTDRELDNVTKTLNEQRKVLDDAAEKAREHADAIGRIRDQLTGRGAIKAALDMTEALRGALPIQALDDEAKRQINKTMGEAIEAYKRFGQVVPPAMNQAYVLTMQLPPAIHGITNVIKELGYEAEIAIPKLYDLPKPVAITSAEFELLGRNAGLTMKEMIPEAAKQSKIGIDDLSRSISQLAQISGGAFSGIAQSIGTLIGAASTFHDSLDQIRNVDWKGGSTFQGILSTTTGILGMVSAAITAAKAIANLFDRNKGRDLVVDFAANLGGFDALHDALLQGGAAGEALWIKLTQGVGRNNPEQAKQIIAEVQRFLDELGKTVVSPTIKPHVEWPDNMPGDPPSDTDPGYASGTPGLGFVNFGARKPTWLHGDEAVVPRHKVGDLAAQIAAAMGGGGGDPEIHVYIGNEELDGRIQKVARKDAAKGGTRQRATVGRSY